MSMESAIVVRGRLVNPTTVELDEPVAGMIGGVEVILRIVSGELHDTSETIFDFLRRIPAGTRTKEDIDHQIRAERDSWGDR